MALSAPPLRAAPRRAWRWHTLTLAARFNLASLLVLLVSMLVTGWWVGAQIRQGVIHRTAATAALYVENFLVTQLQELGSSTWLSPGRQAAIEKLLATTPLGREIVSIKIWAPDGRVVYGQDAGGIFPIKADLARAWRGEISAEITNLRDEENASQRGQYRHLIETYVPMRLEGTDRVIAVAEFYQTTGPLDAEIAQAQRRSWGVVAAITLLTYALLSGLVRRGSDTIRRQQATLREQVGTLEGLLAQNAQLHGRVSRAAARSTAHSERVLSRVSSDLHDGPAQDLSYALLRLDSLGAHATGPQQEALGSVEQSLESALREVRAIATDLRLPDLAALTLREVLERALRDHRRRAGVDVPLDAAALPDDVPLPVKITAFRIVQEALNNAHRHAPGGPVTVTADTADGGWLVLRITDAGPGFTWCGAAPDGHLGLVGMRERAESLGGTFTVRAQAHGGTVVEARVPLSPEEHHD
ncbi:MULTISPECIES: sensor histidine kinase [Deinococcus]|uniref:histidine kinase n=1 Tax=Deinococcus rufus TaxID=2136097 RepID=A0ABV7Z612_9DEIO|nr:sensor histidine kinase [Deinococcus sp. AB2017081]WQE96005.1 sensor histidine kinase [Deinococcus sp. AB2017081]